MGEEFNIKTILKNAIEINNTNPSKVEHILSNISPEEVLHLSEDNTLKVLTNSNDIFNLENNLWKQTFSNDNNGFSTYVSISDESIKILIDENHVEFI